MTVTVTLLSLKGRVQKAKTLKIPSITNASDKHRFVMKNRSIRWLAEVGVLLNGGSGGMGLVSGVCGLSPFAAGWPGAQRRGRGAPRLQTQTNETRRSLNIRSIICDS